MLGKLVLAIVVGIVTTLVCALVGSLLVTVDISWVDTLGVFLKNAAALLGLLAALWYFFAGYAYWKPGPPV